MNTYKIIFVFAITCLIISCGGEAPQPKKEKPKVVTKIEKSDTEETKKETVKKEKEEEEEVVEEVSVDPEQIKKAEEIIASVDNAEVETIDAKALFKMHCAICHGFKGNMKINGAKDLTKSKLPLVESVAQVYHGKGLMTPYKGILKDPEIVAVAKYIETLRK